MSGAGFDVALDDRAQRPGVKFADADLIGYPHRVVVSDKSLDAGELEYKRRRDGLAAEVPVAEAAAFLQGKRGQPRN